MHSDGSLPLTSEQVKQFESEGYLLLENVLSDDDLRPVIDNIKSEVDTRARLLFEAGQLTSTYADDDFEHRLGKISAETDQLALSIWNSQLSLPAFFGLLQTPALLDLANQLLQANNEIIASSVYRLRPKIPNYSYGEVPWHQDSAFFEPFCDDKLILTFWLPLVDSTVERGCLYVMPGQHQNTTLLNHAAHSTLPYLEIPEADLPQRRIVPAELKKGGVLIMTNRTPHASFKNSSDVVRWGMDLRYQSAALPTNAPITRLPGEYVRGTADGGGVIACHPPEPDFLVRSILRPDQVIKQPSDFVRLRTEHKKIPGACVHNCIPNPTTSQFPMRTWHAAYFVHI
eukprot:TRINITY_DN10411_c0_g1_i2.p1 TRINITY_DN10411_c0_g1~~TRINITY_DN10411_c0_g1_i2.p1  ORF type:complete len:343 (+),score=124.78 TRINITY_DN10411_c0_g1_i2:168-1196(+)